MIIVGLGNPGEKYLNTRHNAGFLFLDYLQKKHGLPKFEKEVKIKGKISKSNDMWLIKPLTYMNLSGECVVKLLNYYKKDLKDLVVVFDDVDLPIGKSRFREKGSAGTHNGMRSIIKELGTTEFKRIKIGIESRGTYAPEQQDLHSFVLENFKPEELEVLENVFKNIELPKP